jgi:hypothetical protein
MKTSEKASPGLDEMLKVLNADPGVRAQVIRYLARDHPKDFLTPVNISSRSMIESGTIVSCKEWQE